MAEGRYMQVVLRCYEDDVKKPHIDDVTFKYRLFDESDFDEFHNMVDEFVRERLATWQELEEEEEGEDDS